MRAVAALVLASLLVAGCSIVALLWGAEASDRFTSVDVREYYIGLHKGAHARSFRDDKQYRRRKRWLS